MSVQVTNVDGVHVDDMDVLETSQREVCKDFASQAASANDEDFTLVPEEILDLAMRWRVSFSTRSVSEKAQIMHSPRHPRRTIHPYVDLVVPESDLRDYISLASHCMLTRRWPP